jgi:hypothetical protein
MNGSHFCQYLEETKDVPEFKQAIETKMGSLLIHNLHISKSISFDFFKNLDKIRVLEIDVVMRLEDLLLSIDFLHYNMSYLEEFKVSTNAKYNDIHC